MNPWGFLDSFSLKYVLRNTFSLICKNNDSATQLKDFVLIILRKQYESVASTPMEEYKVPEDFFAE